MTGPNPWPVVTRAETIKTRSGNITLQTLNNIDVVHMTKPESKIWSLDLNEVDDLITTLQWAKWYLTEGKYNE